MVLCIAVKRIKNRCYSLSPLVACMTLLNLASIICTTSQHEVYNIVKTASDCIYSGSNCFTLSDFAANSSQLLRDNNHLIFSLGTHILALNLTVENKLTFKMVSNSSSLHAQVIIKCIETSSLSLVNCSLAAITGIEFVGCGKNKAMQVVSLVLQNSTFEGQENSGTALELIETNAEIHNSIFKFNTGIHKVVHFRLCYDIMLGGALVATYSNLTIVYSHFYRNQAAAGGAVFLYMSTVSFQNCNFTNNFVNGESALCGSHENINTTVAGALVQMESNVTIINCHFKNNSASLGGAMYTFQGMLSITKSTLFNNLARQSGGALYSEFTHITLTGPEILIDGNLAFNFGGVAALFFSSIEIDNGVLMTNNNGVYGSIFYAFNSSIYIHHSLTVKGNSAPSIKTGAITLLQSSLIVIGNCSIEHNGAESGAAMYSSDSRIKIVGGLQVTSNNARKNGGGIFLQQSVLTCQTNGHLTMTGNVALEEGGAIYASGSTIKFNAWTQQTLLSIQNNSAKSGGGLYLETSAKIVIAKYSNTYSNLVDFTGNSADYGGAVFVNDDTLSVACTRADIECFIQDLSLITDEQHKAGNSVSLEVNRAWKKGSNLFGGLLHRCTINAFNVFERTNVAFDGLSYYTRISNSSLNKVSSEPINVCQCVENTPSCTITNRDITCCCGSGWTSSGCHNSKSSKI